MLEPSGIGGRCRCNGLSAGGVRGESERARARGGFERTKRTTPESAPDFTSLQPPCVTLKLSLQNLQYANDAPLLLTVISSGRVQEDKNLAGFLFAGGSILFFPYKLQKFPESRRRCGFLVKIRKNTEGWQHCMICITP